MTPAWRAAGAAVLLAAALALTGCGPTQSPAQRGPGVAPAEVDQHEAEVDDLERVVGSAEAETADDR